jgi:hypothetical protein
MRGSALPQLLSYFSPLFGSDKNLMLMLPYTNPGTRI